MKKVLSIVLVLIFLLGLIGCSSKEKIPSISDVSEMGYEEVNEALTGKDIKDIREAWGEPVESEDKEDVWQLDESMMLFITTILALLKLRTYLRHIISTYKYPRRFFR